jgi:hypothetical protein
MRNLDMSPKSSQPRKSLNNGSSDRKRRASSSSVSSVSSVSSLEDLSEDADDSEEDADDEQEPAVRAPSYSRRRDTKAGRQATRNKRRRVLNNDSSDGSDSESSDDVYAGVDYITDAEDEEGEMEKMEEMMIMESEKTHRPLPSSEFTDEPWAAHAFDDNMFLPVASFFDEEHLYGAMDTFGEPDVTSEAVETPVARRVHFEERSDSSSDSESHTDDDIPGDFLQQDSLDPQLRRMIENDNENYQRNNRRQSEDMFGDIDYGHGNIYHVESEGSSDGSLSGYESMIIGYSHVVSIANPHKKAMMATLQTKISLHRQLLPTLGPFSAVIRPTPWPLWATTRVIAFPVAVDLSWEPSQPIPISQSPWWTAPASTSSSFPHMPLLATTGLILPPTVCPALPTQVPARPPFTWLMRATPTHWHHRTRLTSAPC